MQEIHIGQVIGSVGIRTVVECSCGKTVIGRTNYIDHVVVERARAEAKASR